LYSELDEERWERRKVYMFRNSPAGYAGEGEESRSVELGTIPVPSLDEIGLDAQFEPCEISKEEFESVWDEARSHA
jgi:hypothetical protein